MTELIKTQALFDGQVGTITLADAPANILSAAMMKQLLAAMQEMVQSPKCKLIIITGEGKHFCYGASVEEHKPDQVADMLPAFHNMIGEIIACPVPTLARVSGRCLGGGFELALACTFCFADETAAFAVPEIQLAVLPPVACALLPFKTNDVIASQMVLTGNPVGAADMHKYGFVNSVAGAGKLDEEVSNFIEKTILPKSASSLRMAHRGVRMPVLDAYNTYIGRMEKLYLDELMATHDAVEGIASFLEKRKPEWTNS